MSKGVIIPHGIGLVRPGPVLEPFVRYYGYRKARLFDTSALHPVHARAAPVLDFEFGDADAIVYKPSNDKPAIVSPRSVLVGMQTHRTGDLHITGTVDSFVILLQPAALDLLFGLPAQEFTDRSFHAESVLGREVALLQERFADCRTFEERISVADQFLLSRVLLAARSSDGVTAAARQLLRRGGGARIPAMADRSGLSVRQFRRKFVQKVGISPKLFARIARFEAVADKMARPPGASWTEAAHRFGYYDQMHMVHEFAEFTGETPTRTMRYFEAVFPQQIAAIQSGSTPRSDGDRWIL